MSTEQTIKNNEKIIRSGQLSSVSLVKLSLQLKKKKGNKVNKQAKPYSTTMYTAPPVSERESWCQDEGTERDTETPMKQESFLARGLEL